jgi:hypothetical protein
MNPVMYLLSEYWHRNENAETHCETREIRFDSYLNMYDVQFYGGKVLVVLHGTGLKKFGGIPDGTGLKSFSAERDRVSGESRRALPGQTFAVLSVSVVYWMLKQCAADRFSIQSLLSQLRDYIERREESYYLYDAKIVLRFPHKVTDDFSVNDHYDNFFVAL